MPRFSVNSSSRQRFVTVSAGALATLGSIVRPARAAQFEFKFATALPADHSATVHARLMFTAIERESGGRIHTEYFPNGILGSDAALIPQLRLGAIHFWLGFAYLPIVVPAVEVTQVGFSFKDEPEALRAMDGPLGDFIHRELEAKGLYALRRFWGNGMRVITSGVHSIRTADDLNGFKIRVATSKIVIDFFKTLGATPTTFGLNELYTALQTKLVDGEDAPLGIIEVARYYEVQKYLSLTNHTWAGLAIVTSGDIWKTLPPDLQTIVERNNAKYALLERRDTGLQNAAVADKWARRGIPVNAVDPSSFRARLGPYYATWAKDFGPTAWGLLESSLGRKLA